MFERKRFLGSVSSSGEFDGLGNGSKSWDWYSSVQVRIFAIKPLFGAEYYDLECGWGTAFNREFSGTDPVSNETFTLRYIDDACYKFLGLKLKTRDEAWKVASEHLQQEHSKSCSRYGTK